MTARSTIKIVVSSAALVAVCGAVIVFGIAHVSPPVEPHTADVAPAVSQPPPAIRSPSKLAQTEAGLDILGALGPPQPSVPDEGRPAFDVARIEPTGEAVIAGRAAPGATIELLRNGGQKLDQALADASGMFVMVPPRLPPGEYELTLRSRSPDGTTLAISKGRVPVALKAAAPPSRNANQLPQDRTNGSSQASEADLPSEDADIAKRERVLASPPMQALAAIGPSNRNLSRTMAAPRISTAVVSRGDSLWRISRMTYGDGYRYFELYKANRNRIRDPNLIYPGQVFVLPGKLQ